MDLKLSGKTAIVCAASRGLGRGCAESLAAEGAQVTIVARTEAALQATAAEITARYGIEVRAVAADVTDDEGIARICAACPDPDILVNNAGGPPPGDFLTWDRAAWRRALDANMLSAILLTRAVIAGMQRRKFGRIVNITSAAVRSPLAGFGLSNGARAGLIGFVSSLVREVAKDGITVNNLLPHTFDTDRLQSNFVVRAQRDGVSPEQLRARSQASNPSGRFGTPSELGALCAFLCSDQAAYINGQNIVLDGGAHSSIV
jgi:3-oxoacyl-[acyl-carrier protein] reductase